MLYSGRQIKAIRRYWQKVRASLKQKLPEVEGDNRPEHLLHIATSHFIAECMRRGVKEIAIGDLNGVRDNIDYGELLNQRLHAWPYRKVTNMLKYKGALVTI